MPTRFAGCGCSARPFRSAKVSFGPALELITILPNYGDWNCGPKGGVVQHVKVAGFPGETTINANNQRRARINVARTGNVRLVAQMYCVYGFLKMAGGWNTVDRTIRNPVPRKSYYF